jgi:hypothetical protein
MSKRAVYTFLPNIVQYHLFFEKLFCFINVKYNAIQTYIIKKHSYTTSLVGTHLVTIISSFFSVKNLYDSGNLSSLKRDTSPPPPQAWQGVTLQRVPSGPS